ncbi:MAG: hypothetical protein ACKN9W_11570 [Methylococcus sp.]
MPKPAKTSRAMRALLAGYTELAQLQTEYAELVQQQTIQTDRLLKMLEALNRKIQELEQENQELYRLLQTRGKAKQAPVCRASGLGLIDLMRGAPKKKPGCKPSSMGRAEAERWHGLLVEFQAKTGCANQVEAAEQILRLRAKELGIPEQKLNSRRDKAAIKQAANTFVNRLRNRKSLK